MTWWNDFFDPEVAELILEQPRPGELDFLVHHLNLQPGDRVFDQCCGWGRVTGPLAELGYQVEGVDSSAALIEYGSEKWKRTHLSLTCADAHFYQPTKPTDAAVNLFSSFGYDKDESKHQDMLLRLATSLKTGGIGVLDTINPEIVWQNFRPEISRTWTSGYHLRRESELTHDGRRLHQKWLFTRPNGECFQRAGTTRLYTPEELQTMMAQVGLTTTKLLGDLQSNPFTQHSERLIWVAEKSAP